MQHVTIAILIGLSSSLIGCIADETCATCESLNQCDIIVCAESPVNGTFVPRFAKGCELECSFGRITCEEDTKSGRMYWSPIDPCYKPTTTSTQPRTTEAPSVSKTTIKPDTSSWKPGSTIEQLGPPKLPGKKNGTVPSSEHENSQHTKRDSRTFLWIIIVFPLIGACLLFVGCYVLLIHYRKNCGKVKFPLSHRQAKHSDFIHPVLWDQNSPTYAAGQLTLESETRTNHHHEKRLQNPFGNGISKHQLKLSNHKIRVKPPRNSIPKDRSRLSPHSERRPFNWQESGIRNFCVPPSPRSLAGLNIKQTLHDVDKLNERGSTTPSMRSQSSSPCRPRNTSLSMKSLNGQDTIQYRGPLHPTFGSEQMIAHQPYPPSNLIMMESFSSQNSFGFGKYPASSSQTPLGHTTNLSKNDSFPTMTNPIDQWDSENMNTSDQASTITLQQTFRQDYPDSSTHLSAFNLPWPSSSNYGAESDYELSARPIPRT